MRALLIQHGCEAALEVLPEDMEAQAKAELNKKAHSVVILCLGNKVLREVTGETTAAGVWTKLETLYMTKETVRRIIARSQHVTSRKMISQALVVRFMTIYDDSENAMGAVYCWVTTGSVRSELLAREIYRKIAVGQSQVAGELNASVEEKGSLAQVWHKRLGHIGEAGLQVLEKRVWVYILRFKHKAFGKFKEWKQLVENQTGRTVKKLRMDNGLEFCNQEFEQLCIESKIARHLTVVGIPSPSTTIEKKTPMEMWSGHPSDYRMLRIFRCVAYSHVKQGKLEPRAVKCVLLGYPKGVKGYILYRLDGKSPKIVTSRNVVFNESIMYKDTLKDSGAGNDKSVEELHVKVELQRLNNHMLEEDQTNQDDGDDEDVGDQETDQTPDLTDYQLTQDREPRTRMKPLRFQNGSNMAAYAFVAAEEGDTHEPLTYQEAVACEDSSKWKVAMEEEMDSLRKNKTWELVYPSAGQKLVSSKWLFKIKEGIEGVQKPKFKARLVAGGFTQRACIDYNEVFSPVVRHTSIRVILALTACKDYKLEQLDVKTTFLHGNLKEVIYIRQPPGYEQGNKVCLLKKSLYGLKQSPRQWIGNDKSVEELHVEVELQRLNNHMLEEDQTNQDDGDDEDVGDQETDQTPDLTDYQLTQDLESQGQECNH
ncbi:retrotransposon protein, putative, ty1-copia subclass [Tanacetum coccineum]